MPTNSFVPPKFLENVYKNMSSNPDSPHLGFLGPPGTDGKIYNRVIRRLEKQLKIFTSTPNKMDFSEQRIQGIDCDSGYVSSNLEPCTVAETSSYSTDIYVSEDALMDKPDVKATEDVYEEFSHLYYLNNIVDASISTTKTDFSGFQDSDTSFGSQKSPILEIQPEIMVCDNQSRLVQYSELNLINQPNLYVINPQNLVNQNEYFILDQNQQVDCNQEFILINQSSQPENVGFVYNNKVPVNCSSNELINQGLNCVSTSQNNLGFNCNLITQNSNNFIIQSNVNTQNSNDLTTQNYNSLNQSSNSNFINQSSNYSTQNFNNSMSQSTNCYLMSQNSIDQSSSVQATQGLINQSSNYDLNCQNYDGSRESINRSSDDKFINQGLNDKTSNNRNCNQILTTQSLFNQSNNLINPTSKEITQNSNRANTMINNSTKTQRISNENPITQITYNQNSITQSINNESSIIQAKSNQSLIVNQSLIQDMSNQSSVTQVSLKHRLTCKPRSSLTQAITNQSSSTLTTCTESSIRQSINNKSTITQASSNNQSWIKQASSLEDSTKTKLNNLFKRSNTESNLNVGGKLYSTLNRSSTESNLHVRKVNSFERGGIENNINAINCKASTTAAQRKRKRSLSKTPCKRSASPDLFSDDESLPPQIKEEFKVAEERFVMDSDRLLIKRVNETLSGVPPPPSLTNVELSMAEMLEKYMLNKEEFSWDPPMKTEGNKKESLLVNTNLESCLGREWPDILDDRYHGLHYNRSKLAEEFESLCIKYLQRYVGSETQSSCTVFDSRMGSPSKRRANKLRWTVKSPGRRLSHLARRRITFSSANLQNASGSNLQSQSHARQIMVDAKRFELLSRRPSPRKKSPRKTPRKSPRKLVRTPSSSAKKRLTFRVLPVTGDDITVGPSTSSAVKASQTKRALFRSPDDKTLTNKTSKLVPSTSNPSSSPWKKRSTPKRALFVSPIKSSPSNKRKRRDSDESAPQKIARCLSMQEPLNVACGKLKSVKSEGLLSGTAVQLSTHHKQKLFWAVNEAFRGVNINPKDPQYTPMVSVLARVVRRILPTLPVSKEAGTSTRMLRIAKQHIHSVLKGKTLDEIMHCYEVGRLKLLKPTGYISKEDAAQKMDISVARSSVFLDKANTIMNVGSQEVKAKYTASLPENKADRVRKVINFDR